MWREPTGWAGTRVGAGRVPTGSDAPGRGRRRAVPEFGGLRAAGGFGSSDRFGDAFGEWVAVARKQYADGDRKQGIQRGHRLGAAHVQRGWHDLRADDATEVTAAQLRQVAERIIASGHWRHEDPDILVVFDAGYDLTRLACR